VNSDTHLRVANCVVDLRKLLTIGWGDMELGEIERLRKVLPQITALATTHLEGIPKEFKAS
jgi:hypothetical protein